MDTKDFLAALPVISTGNEYDLRPVTDDLVDLIRERAAKGPLVVGIGESHATQSHEVIVQAIMEKLRRADPNLSFAYNFEASHNFVKTFMDGPGAQDFTPEMRSQVAKSELAGGEATAMVFGAVSSNPEGPMPLGVTKANAMFFCALNRVLFKAVDMVWKHEGDMACLDATDPRTSAAIKKYAPALAQTKIDAGSPEGMALRNFFMADTIGEHMKQTKANVHFLSSGFLHVYGGITSSHEFHPAQWSLSAALARQKDVETLWILPAQRASAMPSPPHDIDVVSELLQKSVRVNGLSLEEFPRIEDISSDKAKDRNLMTSVLEAVSLERFKYYSGGELTVYKPLLQLIKHHPRMSPRLRSLLEQNP